MRVGFLLFFNIAVNLLGWAGRDRPTCSGWATPWSGWAILLLLGLGPTIGGYGLYLVSLGYLPATVANLIGALEPVFTAVWAYLVFTEQMSSAQLIGSLILLGSVVLLRLGDNRHVAAVSH